MDTVHECVRQTDRRTDRITITDTVQTASHGKNADVDDFHFTQDQQLLSKCSKVLRSSTGSFLFISLISNALWLTLSKALVKVYST